MFINNYMNDYVQQKLLNKNGDAIAVNIKLVKYGRCGFENLPSDLTRNVIRCSTSINLP